MLLAVFEASKSSGFQIKKWGDNNFWTDAVGMSHKLESLDCVTSLYGLFTHRPQHWIAHLLQSSGSFVHLDSNVNHGGSFEAADQESLNVAELVQFAHSAVSAGDSVYLLFKSHAPLWSNWKDHGVYGFTNSGNMCYANTAVQSAAAILRALGHPELVSAPWPLGLGLRESAADNGDSARRIASMCLPQNQNVINQNDYSEVLLVIVNTIGQLMDASTLSQGTQVTIETEWTCRNSNAQIQCLRSDLAGAMIRG